MAPVSEGDAKAVDDTAAWAAAHPATLVIGPKLVPSNVALRQSLNHYCNAGMRSIAQELHDHAMMRAHFLRAEAEVLMQEQWEDYESDYARGKVNRKDQYHINNCMYEWGQNNRRMHGLYYALLERAEAAEAEAKHGKAKL